jgi:6-phosphogluconolactonase/glucosamine-6-phosphate isomerase/deaminase
MIELRKVDSDEQVANYIANLIRQQLAKKQKLLWLLSGGSAVKVAMQTANLLSQDQNLSYLTVSLIDERFGELGHHDSNWQQLLSSGLSLPGANLRPVLSGKDIKSTAADYGMMLEEEFEKADFKIGLLGIGPDGHTAGILPGSPAASAEGLVASYEGGGYQRLTTTFKALKELDEAVVYALGQAKWPQIDKLEQDIPLNEQPAQILKQIKKVIIFNDRKGEQL